ncbi:MAG TPA: MBL fold metallo-hydrolase [Candidatus Thermoplasmatota archaeon]|nr:MBL fold metallo-hydrolase [Candidatus Thermoplasmatota archaeon]
MRVAAGNGVEVHANGSVLRLDPKRASQDAVVTHAHSDHLTPDAHMTPPTLDFLRVRKPARSGAPLPYGQDAEVAGLRVRLHDAGHVLGSAMVEVTTPGGSLLYTGDFNPRGNLACDKAKPVACDVLVTESTYGDPRFDLPPRELVLESLEAWTLQRLLKGPVALGAYPLGRAQELVFLANRAGLVPIVSPDIAALTAVYNAHGHDLAYAVAGTERARDLEPSGALHIVPREWLKRDHDFARGHQAHGGSAAYLSGWCHRYSYFGAYAIDAQFALTDHAGFRDLVEFARACGPKKVYTMHGASASLAKAIRSELGIQAEPLA